MKRTTINMVIDATAFIAFALLVSTGLLVRYQLPHGSGDPTHGGFGRAAQARPVTLLWGLSRHDWGDIHYWIALTLMAILAVHVVLHWKWIVYVVRGRQTDASGLRLGLGMVGLIAVVGFAVLPLASSTQQVPRSELQASEPTETGEATSGMETQPAAGGGDEGESAEHDEHEGSGQLRGSMTLSEAAQLYDIPVSTVIERLALPADTSPDERLGRLRQRYDFRMSDVRRMLEEPDEPKRE